MLLGWEDVAGALANFSAESGEGLDEVGGLNGHVSESVILAPLKGYEVQLHKDEDGVGWCLRERESQVQYLWKF